MFKHGITLIILFYIGSAPYADVYMPTGLYDLTSFKLNNGFEVYLRERHEVKNTSIRLVAKVGSDHFECGKQQIAHFLEHLLFTGTSKHTETELDQLIEDNGGTWNAVTYTDTTIYEIDIYSQNTNLALSTLYEIITDSTITAENIEKSRDIIHSELGGEISNYEQLFFDYGIGKSGINKSSEFILPEEAYCRQLDSATNITRDEIINAHRKYYTPNNMALVIVGDFDSKIIKQQIQNTFGTMVSNTVTPLPSIGHNTNQTDEIFTGTLSPVLSNDSSVYIRYKAPNQYDDDYLKLVYISIYLSRKLYNEVRIEKGLAYTANAQISLHNRNVTTFDLSADSKIGNEDKILNTMNSVVDDFLKKPIDKIEFEKIKRGTLLNFTQMFQSNADISSHYAESLDQYLTVNDFIKIEALYDRITPEDVYEVAQKYLTRDKAVMVKETPTLTYLQFYITISILIAVLILLTRIWINHHRK